MSLAPSHVYVHVPFCTRRCSYCDFAIAVRRVVPVDEYLGALAAELALWHGAATEWPAATLYFGGGTPSRLGADGVRRMMDILRARVQLAPGAEVTLEANPEDIDPGTVRAWRDAGITRLSIGAQSFDDAVLEWMHRVHDADAIARAVGDAREGGLDDFSIDLIFAVPETLHRDWERDVELATALQPTHVSLYGLTIEPHTPLGRWESRGEAIPAPEERYEAEFLHAHAALTAAGYDHYEVSNFGRPGHRARHNSAYWTGVPYAGLGPGAHAFDGVSRRWNVGAYAEWVTRLAEGTDPAAGSETLTPDNRVAEAVYLGLRTTDGLLLEPGEAEQVRPWIDAGWGTVGSHGRLVLTPTGWLRLDALAADLTLRRSR